ncbi:hypothetical protein NE857_22465 [Nocardiopsis exhalans]|uniref:Uncharacterized protein n=2 Tax=Nocardiopsis TaxID=2013 RepID=A0A840W3R5_9ACTN|nr:MULTISPECIES: hypothetical protein [Nocardiopsis]MBB5491529.1 hypothetical protein [Nocardiopsis metallicus]USY18079.1 hypothetical protein NE857_22465 [Nocardiopsis exhalans]
MGLRTGLRNEFPRGWWRSAPWWLAGLREIGLGVVAVVATVALLRRAVRGLRSRDEPGALSVFDRCLEGCLAGLLAHLAGLLGLAVLGLRGELTAVPALLLVLSVAWALVNAATAGLALFLVARSRWARQAEWSVIDFVAAWAPRYGRPPETIEEYKAERLRGTDEEV